VLDGPPDWMGEEVWGTGGDLGFTRDGAHAELLAVPVDALVLKPESLSFEEASAVGVNFVTGWLGAVETAELDKGETIAVFGVSGGVGVAVAQIARARGAREQPGFVERTPEALRRRAPLAGGGWAHQGKLAQSPQSQSWFERSREVS
jgi:NADPH2:quinone reductase